jgi:folylpolyglutamate synthase/dihydropteroate synthase
MERFSYKGNTVVLDGCHNGNSVERFLQGLRGAYPGKQLLVLFGAGHEKCLKDMMAVLLDEADEVMMVQSTHFRAMTEKELLAQVPAEKAGVVHALQRGRVGAVAGAEGTADGAAGAPVSLSERLQYAVEQEGKDG